MKSHTLRACAAGIAIASLGMGLATVPTAQAATTLTSKKQLKSVSVPSMCDNPAGTLKDGELPGYYVSLDYAKSKLGQIKPGGGKEAAAVFHCSQGGIGWANHIVFYSSDLKVIGHTDLASVGVTAGRQLVQSVSISAKGTVTARVIAVPLKGDNELWGSAGAKLTFKWDAKKKRSLAPAPRSTTTSRESRRRSCRSPRRARSRRRRNTRPRPSRRVWRPTGNTWRRRTRPQNARGRSTDRRLWRNVLHLQGRQLLPGQCPLRLSRLHGHLHLAHAQGRRRAVLELVGDDSEPQGRRQELDILVRQEADRRRRLTVVGQAAHPGSKHRSGSRPGLDGLHAPTAPAHRP